MKAYEQRTWVSGVTAETGRQREEQAIHVAVVHTPQEICFVTAATSKTGLEERLAEYVQQQARYQLWPDDVRRVEALLAGGDKRAAIWLYFDSTGTRWDDERLHVEGMKLAREREAVHPILR